MAMRRNSRCPSLTALQHAVRSAQMVLPEGLQEAWQKKLGFYSCAVPVFEQYVLAEFLNSGELERYINRRRRKLRQGKA